MSEKKFFCFGKNGFCDNPNGCETGKKCVYINGDGGEYREYQEQNTRLNREAWEPCSSCYDCENCCFNGNLVCEEPCRTCWNNFQKTNNKTHFQADGFCKYCGRPLTDAAWKMLEKRLEGLK